jgi:voltage-gated potassium channel
LDNSNNGNKQLIIAGLLLLLVVSIGVVGYVLLDHFSFIDAFYMTIITVSTVGFGEVQQLSEAGKLFTSGLILTSLVVLGYTISVLTQKLVHSQLRFFYTINNNKNRSKKMENHIIVVGYGRNGKQVVEELLSRSLEVVVVDRDHNIVINNMGMQAIFIEGNATEDDILIKAGIKSAKSLISSLPNDADNLYVVLTARSLKHDLKIISRASSESSEKKLRMAGVDSVVMPERVGGAHMATLIAQPDIVGFLEHLAINSDTQTHLAEIMCQNLPASLVNKPIKEIGVRKKSGANIIGYKTLSGDYIINPSPDTILIPDSKLFVLGTDEQIANMEEMIHTSY